MKMNTRSFATCALSFLALDAVWLTLTGPHLYRPAIGHLMRSDVDWAAAALFYAVYVLGMLAFVLRASDGPRHAALRGAGFGFVAYATYDLTCQATMKDWPWFVTLADLGWGSFATAAACAITAAAARRGRRA